MEKKPPFLVVNKKRIILFVCLLFVCLHLMFFIFNLSSMTSKESAKKSAGIVDNVTEMVAEQKGVDTDELSEDVMDAINFVVRKTGHLLLFALLGMLTYFLSACFLLKGKRYLLPSLFSVPICVVFAISDEIHQTFVKGRHGRVVDVLVDVAGAVIGALVSVALVTLFGKVKKYIDDKKVKKNEKTA